MANLTILDKINKKRKDTVFGYIRDMKSILFPSNGAIIPKGIIYICILFYGDLDKFDPLMLAPNMVLTADDMCLTHKANMPESSFLAHIVETGCHSWKFELNNVSAFTIIGIWMVNDDKEVTNSYFTHGAKGYGYCCHIARITDPKTGYTNWKDYGINCVSGATIEMFVDFNELSLGFKINDKDYGKSHDIIRHKYRAAVYMLGAGDCIKLLYSSST